MGSFRLDRWLPALFLVLAGGAGVVINFVQGDRVFALILLAFFGLIGWWGWPGRDGSHVPHAEAQGAAGDDDLIVYWRPG